MKNKKIKKIVLFAAVVITAAANILICAPIRAQAFVYIDNTTQSALNVNDTTVLYNINIPIIGGKGASPTIYINTRTDAGYYSLLNNYIHIFGDSKLLIYSVVLLDKLRIYADVNDIIYGESVSVDYDITVSTTHRLYITYYITLQDQKTMVSVDVNGDMRTIIAHNYGIGALVNNNVIYNTLLTDDLTTALNLNSIKSEDKASYAIGLVSELTIAALRKRLQTQTYAQGYAAGVAAAETTNTMSWLQGIWAGLDDCLSIEILPNFKLWYLIGLPVSLSLLFFVLKIIRGN